MVALREKYTTEVVGELQEALGLKNRLSVPRLSKIVVNMGFGIMDKDQIRIHAQELGLITGQKPAMTKARKSISNFKLREGMTVGAKVTLRGMRMYEFLDRLINVALPRIRDFRGVSLNSFDSNGNYSLGLQDQSIFPEIDMDNAGSSQGMDITIVTSASDKKGALELLKLLGMPFETS